MFLDGFDYTEIFAGNFQTVDCCSLYLDLKIVQNDKNYFFLHAGSVQIAGEKTWNGAVRENQETQRSEEIWQKGWFEDQ